MSTDVRDQSAKRTKKTLGELKQQYMIFSYIGEKWPKMYRTTEIPAPHGLLCHSKINKESQRFVLLLRIHFNLFIFSFMGIILRCKVCFELN